MPIDYQYILLLVGLALLVLLLFGFAVFYLIRDARLGTAAPSHSQSDLTNMMILFQTMRDILAQQKDLAREFNISLDKKVRHVRELVDASGKQQQEIEYLRRELAALTTRSKRDIAALERRLAEVDGRTGGTDSREFDAPSKEEIEEAEALASEPPLEILPTGDTDHGDDLIDRWSRSETNGLGSTEDSDVDEDIEFQVDDEPLDEEESREAFRDLLNLQPADDRLSPSSSEVLASGEEGNGGQYLTPIQKRVYEYSDAGMRVPEIARELGVGKGEVRLILSLRQDREA